MPPSEEIEGGPPARPEGGASGETPPVEQEARRIENDGDSREVIEGSYSFVGPIPHPNTL